MTDEDFVADRLRPALNALDRRLASSRAVALASQGYAGADDVAAILADPDARARLQRIWTNSPPSGAVLERARVLPPLMELLYELGMDLDDVVALPVQEFAERTDAVAVDEAAVVSIGDVARLRPRIAGTSSHIVEITFEGGLAAASELRTATVGRHNAHLSNSDGRTAEIRVTTGRGASSVDVRLRSDPPEGGLFSKAGDEIVKGRDARLAASDLPLEEFLLVNLVFGE